MSDIPIDRLRAVPAAGGGAADLNRSLRSEDLQPGAAVRGIVPDALVRVAGVQWSGDDAIELTYKTAIGRVANELVYRHDEPRLELAEQGWP